MPCCATNDHPIFCRPLLLHGNSDKDTFFSFFFFFFFLHHLFGQVIDCPQVPVLGSDDEKALRMAMTLAFPAAPRLTCTRHLKQNFSHALADKVVLTKQDDKILLVRFLVSMTSLYMLLIRLTLLTDFST